MNTTCEKPGSQRGDLAGDDAAAIGRLIHEKYDLREARSIYQRMPSELASWRGSIAPVRVE